MGGRGSGAGQNGRNTTSGLAAIDVRRLKRDGILTAGHTSTVKWACGGQTVAEIEIRAEADHVVLNYRCQINGGDPQSMIYRVNLVSSDCHYGGRRLWFKCPAAGCGKRVALLHLGGSGIFACRSCNCLAYASQRMTTGERVKARADEIRSRLGWKGSISHPKGDRPVGMHQRTFNKMAEAHDKFAAIAVDEAMRKFRRRHGQDAD